MTDTINISNGFRVLTGVDSVKDRVERHLKFFLGEDLFRPDAGVPYTEDVFQRNDRRVLLNVIREQVLTVRDVTGADVTVREFVGRRITLDVRVDSIFGRADTTLELGA